MSGLPKNNLETLQGNEPVTLNKEKSVSYWKTKKKFKFKKFFL